MKHVKIDLSKRYWFLWREALSESYNYYAKKEIPLQKVPKDFDMIVDDHRKCLLRSETINSDLLSAIFDGE